MIKVPTKHVTDELLGQWAEHYQRASVSREATLHDKQMLLLLVELQEYRTVAAPLPAGETNTETIAG